MGGQKWGNKTFSRIYCGRCGHVTIVATKLYMYEEREQFIIQVHVGVKLNLMCPLPCITLDPPVLCTPGQLFHIIC